MNKILNTKVLTNSTPVSFAYNGMLKDDEIQGVGNSLDYGARIYNSRIGKWLSRDLLEKKYPSFSPYNFVCNMPIVAIDPDGKDVIIVIYSGSDDRYKQAAWTRVRELQNMAWFDNSKDKILFLHVPDLGKIETIIENQLNTIISIDGESKAVKDIYGKTREFSYFGHGGTDGPIGEMKTSGIYNLANQTNKKTDQNQMTLEGWQNIDFNFGDNSIANFYGCQMSSFASKFAVFQNASFTSGYSGRSGPSTNPNNFESSWNTYDYMYLWDGCGLDIYKNKSAGKSISDVDNDNDGYFDVVNNNAANQTFWEANQFFSMPISSGTWSTNIWIDSTKNHNIHGYKVDQSVCNEGE